MIYPSPHPHSLEFIFNILSYLLTWWIAQSKLSAVYWIQKYVQDIQYANTPQPPQPLSNSEFNSAQIRFNISVALTPQGIDL